MFSFLYVLKCWEYCFHFFTSWNIGNTVYISLRLEASWKVWSTIFISLRLEMLESLFITTAHVYQLFTSWNDTRRSKNGENQLRWQITVSPPRLQTIQTHIARLFANGTTTISPNPTNSAEFLNLALVFLFLSRFVIQCLHTLIQFITRNDVVYWF